MKKSCLIFGIIFLALFVNGQAKKDNPSFFFTNHPPLRYQKAKISHVINTSIENKLLQIQVKGIKGMPVDNIRLLELEQTTEASQIVFYQQNKVVQKLQVPFWFRHILPNADIADFNKDGIAEIIGCTTTNYQGHNYWVYNIYNLKNGALVMVSKDFDYPLWKKVDNKTNKVMAKEIPDDIRLSTLRSFPTEYFVR